MSLDSSLNLSIASGLRKGREHKSKANIFKSESVKSKEKHEKKNKSPREKKPRKKDLDLSRLEPSSDISNLSVTESEINRSLIRNLDESSLLGRSLCQ